MDSHTYSFLREFYKEKQMFLEQALSRSLGNYFRMSKSQMVNGTDQKHTLTREDGGEEYVVREGDEAALPECIKDAVLVCKLLPLLRNLLLVPREKDGQRWIVSCTSAFGYNLLQYEDLYGHYNNRHTLACYYTHTHYMTSNNHASAACSFRQTRQREDGTQREHVIIIVIVTHGSVYDS